MVDRGDATHNQVNPWYWESMSLKGGEDETPIEFIKSLFEINLNHHPSELAFFLPFKGGNKLLGDNDIIHGFPSRDKSSLVVRDKLWDERFDPKNHDFGNNFVKRGAKANRSEISHLLRLMAFGNKTDKSVIPGCRNGVGVERKVNVLSDRSFNNVPIFLEKANLESIFARGFEGAKGEESIFDF